MESETKSRLRNELDNERFETDKRPEQVMVANGAQIQSIPRDEEWIKASELEKAEKVHLERLRIEEHIKQIFPNLRVSPAFVESVRNKYTVSIGEDEIPHSEFYEFSSDVFGQGHF